MIASVPVFVMLPSMQRAAAAVRRFGRDRAAVRERPGADRQRRVVAARFAVGQRDRAGVGEARRRGRLLVFAVGALDHERLAGGDVAAERAPFAVQGDQARAGAGVVERGTSSTITGLVPLVVPAPSVKSPPVRMNTSPLPVAAILPPAPVRDRGFVGDDQRTRLRDVECAFVLQGRFRAVEGGVRVDRERPRVREAALEVRAAAVRRFGRDRAGVDDRAVDRDVVAARFGVGQRDRAVCAVA